MRPVQASIKISKGKIISIEPNDWGVEIISEGKKYKFSDCWAYPGFVDCHGHIFGLGYQLNGLSFVGTKSPEECIERALKHNTYRGDWLFGRGWNQELWVQKVYPNKKLVDEHFKDTPIYFERVDGHACWVNSTALKIAGITEYIPNPPGGQILKDKQGNPTGILIDNAMEFVRKHIPKFTYDQIKQNILDACDELARNGITEVHDMDVCSEIIPLYLELEKSNKLKIRIQSYITAQNDEWLENKIEPIRGEYYIICGLKFYADGALGSRGAALLEPYSDANDSSGLLLIDEKEFEEKARKGIESGFHIAIHAIGDAAVRMVLNTYKNLVEKGVADNSSILRVEHAQIVHPDDLEIFGKYGIIASVQPIHCISDAKMAEARLGERCSYAYQWKSLLKSGAKLIAGSDFPIESHNPLTGIDAFVRRIPFNSNESWFEKEILSREEAIKAYTTTPHFITGNQDIIGKIKVGFDADIAILSQNLYDCKEEDILNTNFIATFCNGKPSYLTQK